MRELSYPGAATGEGGQLANGGRCLLILNECGGALRVPAAPLYLSTVIWGQLFRWSFFFHSFFFFRR